MAYKISGRVLQIGPLQNLASKSGNTYMKQDIIITVRKYDPYTGEPTDDTGNTPKFSFIGERCKLLENLKAGDVVIIHFDISGRAYDKDGRTEYFTEVRPFNLIPDRNSSQSQPVQQYAQPMAAVETQPAAATAPPAEIFNNTPMADDDLPF